MTRSAALEVAFIAALTDINVDAEAASVLAGSFVELERKGKLEPWLVRDPVTARLVRFGDDGAKTRIRDVLGLFGEDTGELVDEDAALKMNKPAQGTRFAVVHLAGLVERIDNLFGGKK